MTPILDVDFFHLTADEQYRTWVDRAEEFEPAIQAWAIARHGERTNVGWIHHVYWRFFRELDRWWSFRNMIEDRAPGAVVPDVLVVRPDEPVQPVDAATARPGRVTAIATGMQPRMYSYWPNACVLSRSTFVFAGAPGNVGLFFELEASGRVLERGHLLPFAGTTEGWYWDREGWIYVCDGPRLVRANPFTGEQRVALDVSHAYPGMRLWQAHTSDDGRTHCATLQRTDDWRKVGTVVSVDGRVFDLPARGVLDESAITSDGRWLIVKEDDDNRIVNLATRAETVITDAAGAVGHSDCGPGYVVGEDNQQGACVRWDLDATPFTSRPLFSTWNMGHISIRAGRCLSSDRERLALVDLQGRGVTELVKHGATVTDYDSQVRANLSPCGTRACYMVAGTVFVLEL